jgi:hypothetical protein
VSAEPSPGEDERSDDGSATSAFRPSRRKVLAVAAWTVPVVIVGTAAPAFASSAPVFVASWGTVCEHTFDLPPFYTASTLHIVSRWRNDLTSTTTVTVNSVRINGTLYTSGITARRGLLTPPTSATFQLPASSASTEVIIHVPSVPASTTSDLLVSYTYNGQQYTSGTNGGVSSPTCSLQLGG